MGKLSIYFSLFFWRGERKARGLLWLRTGRERKINFLLGQNGDSAVVKAGRRPGLPQNSPTKKQPFWATKIVSPKKYFTYFLSTTGKRKVS